MPAWLDIGIVSLTLVAASGGVWRLLRRKRAAACTTGCGGCGPGETKDALVQLGDRRSRSFLADTQANR